METNETLNKQEKGADMDGFSLSEELKKKVAELAPTMIGDMADMAVEIPGADGQMLVKAESPACNERAGEMSIIMIPALLEEGLFFVCSK